MTDRRRTIRGAIRRIRRDLDQVQDAAVDNQVDAESNKMRDYRVRLEAVEQVLGTANIRGKRT